MFQRLSDPSPSTKTDSSSSTPGFDFASDSAGSLPGERGLFLPLEICIHFPLALSSSGRREVLVPSSFLSGKGGEEGVLFSWLGGMILLQLEQVTIPKAAKNWS